MGFWAKGARQSAPRQGQQGISTCTLKCFFGNERQTTQTQLAFSHPSSTHTRLIHGSPFVFCLGEKQNRHCCGGGLLIVATTLFMGAPIAQCLTLQAENDVSQGCSFFYLQKPLWLKMDGLVFLGTRRAGDKISKEETRQRECIHSPYQRTPARNACNYGGHTCATFSKCTPVFICGQLCEHWESARVRECC